MKYIKLFEEHSQVNDLKYLHEIGMIDDLEYYTVFIDAWKHGKFDESDLLEEVTQICKKYKIDDWELIDGRVNVIGRVDLNNQNLSRIPLLFGKVDGNFHCRDNRLTTLDGSPNTVVGSFYCSANQLTNLDGAPSKVGKDFYCSDNWLTNLGGAPNTVDRDFVCRNNDLTTLDGAPNTVGGNFDCRDNRLTTLDGIGEVKGKIYSDIQ